MWHRRTRLALVTLLIAGGVIGGAVLWTLRSRLFRSAAQRADEAFGACLFDDRPGCSKLVPALLDACEEGSAEHCDDAARLILLGHRVKREPTRALELFQRACALGRGSSCSEVGDILRTGNGVSMDRGRALSAYRSACNLEHWQSCHKVGLMLYDAEQARGEPGQKTVEAMLGIACSKGVALACYNYLAFRTRADHSPSFATTILKRMCNLDHLECDVQGFELREPTGRFFVDADVLERVCEECGALPPSDGTEQH
jgi:TPR repeat protein